MTADMELILRQTIELGRSFIVNEYQRKPVSLMLWKGILNVLLRHDEFARYLMGPVNISGEFQNSSKSLIAAYLRNRHLRPRKCATHPSPDRYRRAGTDRRDADRSESIRRADQQDRMRYRTESFHDPDPDPKIPAGSALGFNTDHTTSGDGLDALILVDLAKYRKDHSDVIQEMTDIDVIGRFSRYRPTILNLPSCRAYACII